MLIVCTAWLGGCASGPSAGATSGGRFEAGPGQYERAFEIARDELAAVGFALDRVDAYSGVISTRPKLSGGLATPWDREQTGAGSEVADLMHPQRRVVRIGFVPASGVDRMPGDEPVTQITGEGTPESMAVVGADEPLIGQVEVVIERVYRPYRRISTVDVLSSSRTTDPTLGSRGMSGSFGVVTQRDHALEERLASRIAARLRRGE